MGKGHEMFGKRESIDKPSEVDWLCIEFQHKHSTCNLFVVPITSYLLPLLLLDCVDTMNQRYQWVDPASPQNSSCRLEIHHHPELRDQVSGVMSNRSRGGHIACHVGRLQAPCRMVCHYLLPSESCDQLNYGCYFLSQHYFITMYLCISVSAHVFYAQKWKDFTSAIWIIVYELWKMSFLVHPLFFPSSSSSVPFLDQVPIYRHLQCPTPKN